MKRLTMFLLLIVLTLAACGGGDEGTETAAETGQPQLVSELFFFNWADYIAPDVMAQFEKEYGVKIIEDNLASNEDLLAKLQGGAAGYDVIVPSDYMVVLMIEEGLLAEFNPDNLPNLAHLDPIFADPPYDPGLAHCVPYLWGTTGIGFDWDYFDEPPDSWGYLFDPALASEYDGI